MSTLEDEGDRGRGQRWIESYVQKEQVRERERVKGEKASEIVREERYRRERGDEIATE